MEGADAVYPATASALARGRRLRRATAAGSAEPRARRKTMPVTFAEIKEVDEESGEPGSSAAQAGLGGERRRRADFMDERLGGGGALAARRRRARDPCLRELSPPARCAGAASGELTRSGSEPAALHRVSKDIIDADT